MGTKSQTSQAEIERLLVATVFAQRMAGAEPSETALEISRRQAAGELTGDEAVAEALAAVRARFARA